MTRAEATKVCRWMVGQGFKFVSLNQNWETKEYSVSGLNRAWMTRTIETVTEFETLKEYETRS